MENEYLLTPEEERPDLTAVQRERLAGVVRREAEALAAVNRVSVLCEKPRRGSDLALLWFAGERSEVLRVVGAWSPDGPFAIQIAHAGPRGVDYELALYAVADGDRFDEIESLAPGPAGGRSEAGPLGARARGGDRSGQRVGRAYRSTAA